MYCRIQGFSYSENEGFYILVLVILHIGPCLTFYNYIYVLFLIKLLILITQLIY
jgi:hypothetical protein